MNVFKWSALAWLFAANFAFAQIPQPTDAPRPLTPEQSAAAFRLPDGFRMEVVASEPLLASPSAVCWDDRGRMFVSELHGYNLAGQLDIEELNKTGKLDTQVRRVQADEKFKHAAQAGTFGVVKLLRDTNGDGRMDVADIFATNLPPIYGLVPARGGVIVACAPDIVLLADRDGDGQAETREVLFTGFPTGELERGINAPQSGVDGWIYFGRGWGGGKITGPHLREPVQLPGSDFRIRADGTAIEPVTGATHTFGFAMTESGDRFTVTTTVPGIFIAPLPWRYLARNPDAATPSLEAPTGDRRAYAISKPHPWRQKRADDPAYFNYYKSRYGAAESEAAGWFTAACGPMIYQDRVLPGLRGQYFVCEPAGNLIHRALIEAEGSVLKLRRAPAEEKSEFAASTDAWSHPMNLTHGPDGCIWITDYYREIIEDYSAIPRHLQQQYGLYAGHDRGRIYRLTHRDVSRGPSADMSALDIDALARECSSPLFWRRQTAQRLLVERGAKSAAAILRQFVGEPSAVITKFRTLDQLGVLTPDDVQPFFTHADPVVRIHALQLGDRWFAKGELLGAALTAAGAETNPGVQIQFALSLGETRDPRAFAMLAQFAREKLAVRWMDTALLSSLHGRGLEMFRELIRNPGGSASLLPALAQTIAARRDQAELGGTLDLIAAAKPVTQTNVLNALVKGRKNAPRKPLTDKSARAALARLAASPITEVRTAARALEDTFVATVVDDEALVPPGQLPPVEQVSDETFRKFVVALAGPRDLKHGHEIFLQACAPCHRIGNEGSEVGPDLVGQLGMAEESLLKDILMPNERIRPGFETTLVQTRDGGATTGLLKNDDATSLILMQANGVEQVLLRKDVLGVRRLAASLMPSYAEGLNPSDVADLLAWLRKPEAVRTGPDTEKRFPPLKVPPGFKATLFACDPLIEYPSVLALGPRLNSIFLAHDYMTGLGERIVRRDEVRLVEDTDADGYADKSTLWAGDFNSIQGLAYDDGRVFVMHAPFLTVLRDSNGDDLADERRDLLSGLGWPPERTTDRLHGANGVVVAHDGWLYLALGDRGCDVHRPEGDRLMLNGGGILRCRPDGSDLHVFSTGLRNIYDIALDEELNVFVRDNENDGGTYMIRVCHSFMGADHGYPYLYQEHPDEALPPLADLGRGSSAGGVAYLEHVFPAPYQGALFFCEWGKSVVMYPRERKGAGFAAMKETEFAAGAPNDPYGFRPTDIIVDRDGSLLATDWADGQRPKRGRGRIYRIQYEDAGGRASSRASYSPQLRAVWALARSRDTKALFEIAELDSDLRIRAQAIRAIGDLFDPVLVQHKLAATQGDPKIARRLSKLGRGQDPRVMLELIIALGRLRWSDSPDWLKANLGIPDPTLAHAAVQTLRRAQNWPAVLPWLDMPDSSPLRPIALRALAEQAEPDSVDGLIRRLETSKDAKRRREYAELLCRVHRKPGPWVYWGFRPGTKPPNTEVWERTEAIEAALNRALKDPDRQVRLTTVRHMEREKIRVPSETLTRWLRGETKFENVAAILASYEPPKDGSQGKTVPARHVHLSKVALDGGNAVRGREIFFNAEKAGCVKCHRLGKEGTLIGPDLTGAGKRFAKIHIIESILEPNRVVAPAFRNLSVRLKDGQELTGVMMAETESELKLGDAQGQPHTLKKEQIEELQILELSIMPEGLESGLTDAEFVDLVGFLAEQK